MGKQDLNVEHSVLKKPDGSVQYMGGETEILVAVYGPADCKESAQFIDRAAVCVNFRPKFGIPGVAEKFYESMIQNISETAILTHLHPRTQISITVQVIQDNGSLLSCCINAVTLALQDAGISMKFLPISVSMIVNQKEESKEQTVSYMPSKNEENESISQVLFVFDSTNKDIICSNVNGMLSTNSYRNCLQESYLAYENTLKFYKDSINKKYSQEFA